LHDESVHATAEVCDAIARFNAGFVEQGHCLLAFKWPKAFLAKSTAAISLSKDIFAPTAASPLGLHITP
jgi:hypothetical protein